MMRVLITVLTDHVLGTRTNSKANIKLESKLVTDFQDVSAIAVVMVVRLSGVSS